MKGYDKNPRKGNIAAIAESLEVNKQYRPIVVQKSTNKILAGNHTWQAAKKLGWTKIAVVFVDVDDEGAKRIVLADNRTNDLADYDTAILAELLKDLGSSSGTGYSAQDMETI
ncbi:MAG: DNA modification methylase, partial [Actinobacteria bacterium]|nr:DNA modification methylase [Actinomycetota bacterium]